MSATFSSCDFSKIRDFSVKIYYYYRYEDTMNKPMELHNHDVYEMYVNLTGNVTFIVNDNTYLLQSGDIIISRPMENHRAIHSQDNERQRFVLFFCGEGAKDIFEEYLKDVNSHIVLPAEKSRQFISLCRKLLEQNISEISKITLTFELLQLLSYNTNSSTGYNYDLFPADMALALEYIDTHIMGKLLVSDIAKNSFVSVVTLERHFLEYLQMTPIEFIKNKRLSMACVLLAEGKSVQETFNTCGFSDYSHFIQTFKKTYGVTPLKFKKQRNKQ